MGRRNTFGTVLVAATDPTHRRLLTDAVRHLRNGLRLESYADVSAAIPLIRSGRVSAAFLDVRGESRDAIEKFLANRQGGKHTPLVLLCQDAPRLEAVRGGDRIHVLPKPFSLSELRAVIDLVLPPSERSRPKQNPSRGRGVASLTALAPKPHSGQTRRTAPPATEDEFVFGESEAIRKVLGTAARIARSDCTVLLRGGIGSGKTTLARYLHALSDRREGPFIEVGCGSVPEQLAESELFGHEKDAFTGAGAARPGRFDLASGGTLLLDDVQNLPWAVQAKLLRVLQEKTYERVGGVETLHADVRVIAATNQDLARMASEAKFREDLYWRLNVVPLKIPALGKRQEDIPLLIRAFLQKFSVREGKGPFKLSDALIDHLTRHPWPGNVRQLSNAIERLVILATGDTLELDQHHPSGEEDFLAELGPHVQRKKSRKPKSRSRITSQALDEALEKAGGNRSKAAKSLGITRRYLHTRLQKSTHE